MGNGFIEYLLKLSLFLSLVANTNAVVALDAAA